MTAFVKMSPHAAQLREAYDAEGLSNPIGTFVCPHCHETADVEYTTTDYEFPSGAGRECRADCVDVARCFLCDGVSYWLILDMGEGSDWRDFPRYLLHPMPLGAKRVRSMGQDIQDRARP